MDTCICTESLHDRSYTSTALSTAISPPKMSGHLLSWLGNSNKTARIRSRLRSLQVVALWPRRNSLRHRECAETGSSSMSCVVDTILLRRSNRLHWLEGLIRKKAVQEGAPVEDADPGHPPRPVRPQFICRVAFHPSCTSHVARNVATLDGNPVLLAATRAFVWKSIRAWIAAE